MDERKNREKEAALMAKKKKAARKKTTVKKSKKSVARKKKVAAQKSRKVSAVRTKPAKAKKTATPPSSPATYQPAANETKLGEVEDYFSHIGVIALNLQNSLSVGGTIHVHGHTTDLTQKVESMQINHVPVQSAKNGDSVGIKVNDKCRKGDTVYRVN